MKHGPRPSMAGSADWTRRSSKGTEGSVVNDDQPQPPVPQLPDYRDRASLGVTSTSIGVSPKSQTRFKINQTRKQAETESVSSSANQLQLHLSTSSSAISPLPRSMRKVSPGIMSRATVFLDRGAGESSSSGQSTVPSSRRPSPAELTTAPTSLEPSDDDETGPSSPCPSPCAVPLSEITKSNPTSTPVKAPNAPVGEEQLAKGRELAELKCELERNAIILRTLVDKLREQDEDDEALRNDVDMAVEHGTPRSRVVSSRGTPRDGSSRVKVAIDVELQVTGLQTRSPKTSTPTTMSRSAASPSSLRTRVSRREEVDVLSEVPIPSPLRARPPRQLGTDRVQTGSPRSRVQRDVVA